MAIDRERELKSPDSNYVLDLMVELQDSFREQDSDIDEMRSVREMRVPAMAEADSRYQMVHVDPRDPDITEEAFQQTAILTLERPKLSIVSGEGDTAQTVASKLEHWTEQTLWQCGTRDPGSDTMTQVTDSTLNDGGGWAKILWAADLWQGRYAIPSPKSGDATDQYLEYDKLTEDAKKKAGPPFLWQYVDPRTVYPQRSGGRLAEVLEVREMTMRHAFRKYRLGRNSEGDIVPEELGSVTLPRDSNSLGTRDPLSTVQFLEHWDQTWCFPAETMVESDSDLVGAHKRWYQGELVTIRTARGYELSGTPNHPVMTERGWVALGQLTQGDRVFSRTFSEYASARNPDPQHGQSPIGEVFGFLDRLGVRERRRGSRQDFHGDGMEHQVDVVRTDRVLWNRILSALAEPVQQVIFAPTNETPRVRIGLRHLERRTDSAGLATGRRVPTFSRGAKSGTLLRRHALPAQTRGLEIRSSSSATTSDHRVNQPMVVVEVRSNLQGRLLEVEIPVQHFDSIDATEPFPSQLVDLSSTPHRDAASFEPRADGAVRNAEGIADLDTGLTQFDVAMDDVVHVERKQWSGHVYNLESIGHTYSANGIIVHNCTYMVSGRNFRNQATGQIVKQFRHKYPFGVPYDYAPGLTMSWMRDRKVGWGIGRTKLWLVKYRAYLRAMHAQYVARDLLSPLVTYGDTPAAAVGTGDGLPREQTDLALHPGEILNLPPGRQLQRIEYADASTLEKHMSLVDQAIRDLESPRVTTLSGMEGAGFAISQILSFTRTRVGPVRHGLEALLYGQTEKLWELVRERAGEKVWVFYAGTGAGGSNKATAEYIGFGPKDLERPMHAEWSVQAQLPTDQLMQVRYVTERLNNGTFGKDEAVTAMGDNPDEIRRSVARDEIRASEPYKKWLYAEVFMNAGRGDLLQKAQEAEQLALGGQVGAGAGAPGLPPGGPPGGPGPGVFEGAPGGVPDLAALSAAPNGAGMQGPPGPQVMAGAAQPGGGM